MASFTSEDGEEDEYNSPFLALLQPRNYGAKRTQRQISEAIRHIGSEDNFLAQAKALTKCEGADHFHIVKALSRALAANGEVLKFRCLSKEVAKSFYLARAFEGAFEKLYVSPRFVYPDRERSRHTLKTVAHGCKELRVKFKERNGNHDIAPGAVFYEGRGEEGGKDDWAAIFDLMPELTTLSISTEISGMGLSWNRTSSGLTALRVAFEKARLKKMRVLRLLGVDMVYITQFYWKGPAFGTASHLAAAAWAQIQELEVQILPKVEGEQQELARVQMTKVFNAFLLSFAPSLVVLKLSYMAEEGGQHPFTLMRDLPITYRGQPEMEMPVLRELWVGRCKDEEIARELLDTLVPALDEYYVLVRGHPHAKKVAFRLDSVHEQWQSFNYTRVPMQRTRGLTAPERRPALQPAWTSPENFPIVQPRSVQSQRTSQNHDPVPLMGRLSNPIPRKSTASPRTSGTFFGRSSQEEDPAVPLRHTSLPNARRTKRTFSGLSSLFKSSTRPYSEGSARKASIRVLGETKPSDVPGELRGKGYTTLSAKVAELEMKGGVMDVGSGSMMVRSQESLVVERQPLPDARIGTLAYTPGSVFAAGPGAKLPEKYREMGFDSGVSALARAGAGAGKK